MENNANRYSAGELLFATKASEIYSAIDSQVETRAMLLVRSRFPLEDGSKISLDQRLSEFAHNSSFLPPVALSGVDVRSHLYVIFETAARTPITQFSQDATASERLFISLVREIAKLHEQNIVLADLSAESILVTPSEELSFVGVLGGFDAQAKKTAMLPPKESLHYSAPELRSGGVVDKASDVFALAVIGYKMFTGKFPGGEQAATSAYDDLTAAAPAPSSVNLNAPFWLDDILGTALATSPQQRFPDASKMLGLIEGAKSSGASPGGLSHWSKKVVAVKPKPPGETTSRAVNSEIVKRANRDEFDEVYEKTEQKQSKKGILIAAVLISLLGVGLLLLLGGGGSQLSSFGRELQISENIAPQELRPALNDLKASGVPIDRKLKALDRIAESDDRVIVSLLHTIMKHASEPEISNRARDLMVEKIDGLGYPQTSSVLGEWFAGVSRQGSDPSRVSIFDSLVTTANPGIQTPERIKALNEVVDANLPLGLQLAASLSLDTRSSEEFLPEFRRLLKVKSNVANTGDKTVYSLLIADKSLLALFERDIKTFLGEFSPSELAGALEQLSGQGHSLLFAVANEIVERDIVPTYQALFLKILTESNQYSLPTDVRSALVKGAKGEFNNTGVAALSRWYDTKAEQALLAICALKGDEEIGSKALSTLAARTLNTEPARSLVSWTKQNFWKYRSKIAKSIGILGLSELATEEELEFAMNRLVPYAGNKSFLKLIRGTKRVDLLLLLLNSIGSTMESSNLLDLTNHKDSDVRIAAIKALKGRNDLHVLREIYQAYKTEKDEEVRKVYEELHWVTKDRANDF